MLITYGAALDTALHRHHAIQLVWAKGDSSCQWSDGHASGNLIIDSQVEHKLQLDEGWILLVEPQCELGINLGKMIADKQVVPFNHLLGAYVAEKPQDSPNEVLAPLLKALNISFAKDPQSTPTLDKRIQALLTRLDLCLQGACQKPASWRASEVASELSMSESRFRHLFSTQMGIAWRPYLRWRRLSCAITAMMSGHTATESAHLTGFADSAHLSRTFRAMFGISIQQAKALFASS
ncbi:helix-turn-helix transcriptional regulator [Shewanella sp. KX20019]|uniref:helix-turn-helix transcriptional regulator n=1 Tax=Shewanella sp. KX20019 TaxID=2803864 RepID=UPI0019296F41|nr:helix-turn-helix transcriptional regulator [Shewanella sp. KX20019]QQX80328.1 helix-turn-helix transcriptional regulator [Shewanella sp. KX20019]